MFSTARRHMNRRDFIKSSGAIAICGAIDPLEMVYAAEWADIPREFLYLDRSQLESAAKNDNDSGWNSQDAKPVFPIPKTNPKDSSSPKPSRAEINLYLQKMRQFNQPHPDDVYIASEEMPLLISSQGRLHRVRSVAGFGNFYLLSFDDVQRFAKQFPKVGAFTAGEVQFLEKLFYTEAVSFGFFGDKTLSNFTHKIPKKNVTQIPGTANYLYKGQAVAIYDRLLADIGPQAVLTSGVRSVMKQFDLFLRKVVQCNGNLSMASRSIAPPGYSYHGVSDFDIGKKGYGGANFSAKFTETDVFKLLTKLDYVKIRYNQDNMLGVRFEPWHVKVELSG
jgi:D-alanyl-D-alanine carboxypeptidase-like protein